MASLRFRLLISISLFSCGCYSQEKLSRQDEEFGLPKSYLAEFRNDKNGCSGIRGKFADSIPKIKSLVGISRKLFLKTFGPPDTIKGDNLIYYVDSKCDINKKRNWETDGSWLDFYFENGKLRGAGFVIQ